MQPTFRHVPPNLNSPRGSCHCSIHATEYPSCAARIAAIQPPGPAPITMTSNDLDMMIDFFLSNFTVHLRRDCADISGMRGYRQIEYRHLDMKVPSMRFICYALNCNNPPSCLLLQF